MNTRSRPHIPRNDFTSVRLPQGGQSRIFCTVVSSATLPSYVQQCPTTTADGAQAVNFFPLNVPPYAFTLCNTRLRLLRCSQMNLLIPGFLGIVEWFWWPPLDQDLQWYCRSCHQCQVRQINKIVIPPTVATPASLFRRVHM